MISSCGIYKSLHSCLKVNLDENTKADLKLRSTKLSRVGVKPSLSTFTWTWFENKVPLVQLFLFVFIYLFYVFICLFSLFMADLSPILYFSLISFISTVKAHVKLFAMVHCSLFPLSILPEWFRCGAASWTPCRGKHSHVRPQLSLRSVRHDKYQ